VPRNLNQAANLYGPHLFAFDQVVNYPTVHPEDFRDFGDVEYGFAIPLFRQSCLA
jgi:hypothetical protein